MQGVLDRIVMPDTSSVVLDNLAATDPAGPYWPLVINR